MLANSLPSASNFQKFFSMTQNIFSNQIPFLMNILKILYIFFQLFLGGDDNSNDSQPPPSIVKGASMVSSLTTPIQVSIPTTTTSIDMVILMV